jgi:hypothetical protein
VDKHVQVNHIKTALDKLFKDKIDMSDYAGKPDAEKEKAFYSRAMAAYGLHITIREQTKLYLTMKRIVH